MVLYVYLFEERKRCTARIRLGVLVKREATIILTGLREFALFCVCMCMYIVTLTLIPPRQEIFNQLILYWLSFTILEAVMALMGVKIGGRFIVKLFFFLSFKMLPY